MAPILSIRRNDMLRIRGTVSLSAVSVWEEITDKNGQTCVKSCRSGFVLKRRNDRCLVITLSEGLITAKGLSAERKIFVRDVHGSTFEGSAVYDSENKSNLAAVVVHGLNNTPVADVLWSETEAKQGDAVVHVGTFNEDKTQLNFSSGMVGLIKHTTKYKNRRFARFAHGCSQKLYLAGAPVFNLKSQLVGLNFSQKKDKDLFFAMKLAQIKAEFQIIFGRDIEEGINRIIGLVSSPTTKKRKLQ
ncbi:hypothetical protein EJB05_32137 [Eragrostis curvula]|uniref:Uncharacterized protein n=1 Tax=Eragrostis curvula TaxID=38414 RepID=A0A5J9UGR3_9POAL|nr:hypothetical protein EJB05_32137 [Eragrostis curvula]